VTYAYKGQGYLLRHQPDIVHFSGHGSASSEIILEDSIGNSHAVTPRALSQLFSVLKDNIRCVLLNACYSETQAQAIAKHIDCVIGMTHAIGDQAAISFAAAFYQALGYGRNVKDAFDLGCVQIDLENLDEQDTPKLLAINSTPESITFV
jgi:CHAT domain